MSELPKTYDPKAVEDKLYSFWNDSGFFHAEVNPKKKPYTIVIPPPNVTGQLHMGHAFDETLNWPFTAGGGLPLALRRLAAFTGMPDGSFTAKKCSLTATLIPLCAILSAPAIMP